MAGPIASITNSFNDSIVCRAELQQLVHLFAVSYNSYCRNTLQDLYVLFAHGPGPQRRLTAHAHVCACFVRATIFYAARVHGLPDVRFHLHSSLLA